MKKENRIKKNEEISQIVLGKMRVQDNYFLIYYKENKEMFRACVSVSKKYGKAFERNYAKRVTRSLLLKYLKGNKKMDLVVVIKAGFKDVKYQELEKSIDYLINKIERKLTKGDENEKI